MKILITFILIAILCICGCGASTVYELKATPGTSTTFVVEKDYLQAYKIVRDNGIFNNFPSAYYQTFDIDSDSGIATIRVQSDGGFLCLTEFVKVNQDKTEVRYFHHLSGQNSFANKMKKALAD
ncbi:MAG: hypothetical protein HY911_04800 [Desulfobacterales bacterium]|nr:hypothetical protein [Desulfobacterales bacterium]